jgi:hypothetical protein
MGLYATVSPTTTMTASPPLTLFEILAICNETAPDLRYPGLRPPPGVLPFTANAYSVFPEAQGIGIVCCVLVGIDMIIRILTRARSVKIFALEDAIMIILSIGFLTFVVRVCDSAKLGLGKHQRDVTVADLMRSLH